MRKRYTRRYRQGPPVRWKWSMRAEAELVGWERDVRNGELDDALEDARRPRVEPSPDEEVTGPDLRRADDG